MTYLKIVTANFVSWLPAFYDRVIVNQFRRNQTSRATDLYDPVIANQLPHAVEDECKTHAGQNEAKDHQDDDYVLLLQRVRQSSSLRLQQETMKTREHLQGVPKKCIHILRDVTYVKCVYIFWGTPFICTILKLNKRVTEMFLIVTSLAAIICDNLGIKFC